MFGTECDLLATNNNNNNNNMNDEIKAVFAQNKNNILTALRAAGVKECTIRYSGSGDSGNLEEPDFGAGVPFEFTSSHSSADDVKIEQRNVTIGYDISGERLSWTTFARTYKVSEPKTVGLREAIENLCYAKLEDSQGGWEINDGSQGSFVIDVEAGTIEWHHETNIVEVETSGETF